MSQKTFSLVVGVIFSLIALGHILRVAFRLEWIVEGRAVPLWVSWVALFVAGYLAYQGFRLGKKSLSGP